MRCRKDDSLTAGCRDVLASIGSGGGYAIAWSRRKEDRRELGPSQGTHGSAGKGSPDGPTRPVTLVAAGSDFPAVLAIVSRVARPATPACMHPDFPALRMHTAQ